MAHVKRNTAPHGPSGTDSRALAAEVLRRLEADSTVRASELLQAALGRLPDARDRALVTELVYGVLRWQRRLDWSLGAFMARGVGAVEPLARALLRVGAHQLRMLDRIPPEIAVSATQDAARAIGLGRVTGLLNAVLRKVAGAPEELPKGFDAKAIGVRASLPDWVVVALGEALGVSGEALEREAFALRERPRVSLRPTLGKGGAAAAGEALLREGIATTGDGRGLLEVGAGDPFATAAAREGLFVAQDGSGRVVVDEVAAACGGALEGKRVLDLCAGRGVKTTALADRGAQVVAVDISRGKLDELVRVARRLGVVDRIERTVHADGTHPEALAELGEFDAVLVDAPCTGLGTLRRHPEIAWRARPEDVPALAELQARLATAGAAHVKPGGGLVYAVCSFVRAEGEVPLPSGFEEVGREALAPSSGLDAFQVRRWRRSS